MLLLFLLVVASASCDAISPTRIAEELSTPYAQVLVARSLLATSPAATVLAVSRSGWAVVEGGYAASGDAGVAGENGLPPFLVATEEQRHGEDPTVWAIPQAGQPGAAFLLSVKEDRSALAFSNGDLAGISSRTVLIENSPLPLSGAVFAASRTGFVAAFSSAVNKLTFAQIDCTVAGEIPRCRTATVFTTSFNSSSNVLGDLTTVLSTSLCATESRGKDSLKGASVPVAFVGTSLGLFAAFSGQPQQFGPVSAVSEGVSTLACGASHAEVAVGTADRVLTAPFPSLRRWQHTWLDTIIDRAATGLAYAGSDLWVANSECINRRTGSTGAWERIDGLIENPGSTVGGLPTRDLLTIVSDNRDFVWIGAVNGTARFSLHTSHHPEWRYFFSDRWLAGSAAESIALANGGWAFVATAEGGLSAFREPATFTLLEKSRLFVDRTPAYGFDRIGYIAGAALHEYGNLASFVQSPGESDALWTSFNLAAMCFQYAASGGRDEAIWKTAWQSFEAMEFLYNVTGIEGLMARTVQRISSSQKQRELDLLGGWSNSTTVPGWQFMTGTSSDDVTGHMFVYPLVHDLLARTPNQKARAARLVTSTVAYIVKNNYFLIDVNGKPTEWGNWNPHYLNDMYSWNDERGLNSLQIVAYLASAQRLAPSNTTFQTALKSLLEDFHYSENLINQRVTARDNVNFSDDELGFLSYHLIYWSMRMGWQPSSQLCEDLQNGFHRSMRIARSEKSSFYNAVALGRPSNICPSPFPDEEGLLADAVWDLQRFPIDPICFAVPNSNRSDVVHNSISRYDNRFPVASVEVLPSDERECMRWNLSPFKLSDGAASDGMSAYDWGKFQFPYWFLQWLGLQK